MKNSKLVLADITVNGMTVHFEAKIPTQKGGSIETGAFWNVTLKEGQNPREVMKLLQKEIQDTIREQITPIAQRNYDAVVKPMLATLTPKERDEFLAKFGVIQYLQQTSPEIAAFVQEEK